METEAQRSEVVELGLEHWPPCSKTMRATDLLSGCGGERTGESHGGEEREWSKLAEMKIFFLHIEERPRDVRPWSRAVEEVGNSRPPSRETA